MKKILSTMLCAALLLSAAACGNGSTGSQSPSVSAPAASVPAVSGEEVSGESEASLSTVTLVEDAQVRLELVSFRQNHTTDEIIDLSIQITNIGTSPIGFVQGSGSNLVPEALQLDLDGLIPLYIPLMTTMDYQVKTLEVGESILLECPTAPYRSADDTFFAGTDKDLKFFEEGDFAPAEAGDITGTVRFSYFVITGEDAGQSPPVTDEENLVVLEGSFIISIQ